MIIQLVYVHPTVVWQKQLELDSEATVDDALRESAFFRCCPDYNPSDLRVGVFGRECAVSQRLRPGDRIEIYRPLRFDPMESRRRRARHKAAKN